MSSVKLERLLKKWGLAILIAIIVMMLILVFFRNHPLLAPEKSKGSKASEGGWKFICKNNKCPIECKKTDAWKCGSCVEGQVCCDCPNSQTTS